MHGGRAWSELRVLKGKDYSGSSVNNDVHLLEKGVYQIAYPIKDVRERNVIQNPIKPASYCMLEIEVRTNWKKEEEKSGGTNFREF